MVSASQAALFLKHASASLLLHFLDDTNRSGGWGWSRAVARSRAGFRPSSPWATRGRPLSYHASGCSDQQAWGPTHANQSLPPSLLHGVLMRVVDHQAIPNHSFEWPFTAPPSVSITSIVGRKNTQRLLILQPQWVRCYVISSTALALLLESVDHVRRVTEFPLPVPLVAVLHSAP